MSVKSTKSVADMGVVNCFGALDVLFSNDVLRPFVLRDTA